LLPDGTYEIYEKAVPLKDLKNTPKDEIRR